MQKGFTPIVLIIIGVLIIAAVSGAYYFGKVFSKPVSAPAPVPQGSLTSQPTSDETVYTEASRSANWKTYTSEKLGLSFKYPESYTIGTTDNGKGRLGVYLIKDLVSTNGGGQGGSAVMRKGVSISATLFPNKSLAEKDLRSEYGSDIIVNKVTVDQKEGIEIIYPKGQIDRDIYFPREGGALLISLGVGFENSVADNQVYTADFNQILSTFRFD